MSSDERGPSFRAVLHSMVRPPALWYVFACIALMILFGVFGGGDAAMVPALAGPWWVNLARKSEVRRQREQRLAPFQ
jgi:hypothetical protein